MTGFTGAPPHRGRWWRAGVGVSVLAIAGIGAVVSMSASGSANDPASPADAAVTDEAPGRTPPDSDARALELLRRSAEAASVTAYSGVQFVSTWGVGATASSAVVQIAHVPGVGSLVRSDDSPVTSTSAVFAREADNDGDIDAGEVGSYFQLLDGPVSILSAHFGCTLAGTATVAGRPTDVVEVHRVSGTVAGRFWIDTASALLLRREVYDTTGHLTSATAFVTVSLDSPAMPTQLPPALPARWDTPLGDADLTALRAAGWQLPAALPFSLTMYDARATTSAGTTPASLSPDAVVHVSYSDGLSTVSVFEQRGHLDPASVRGWQKVDWGGHDVYLRDTLPLQVVWGSAGMVYTVVADAPAEAARAVVESFPHTRSPSTVQRIRGGLQRVGEWLNPFG